MYIIYNSLPQMKLKSKMKKNVKILEKQFQNIISLIEKKVGVTINNRFHVTLLDTGRVSHMLPDSYFFILKGNYIILYFFS